MSLKKSSAYSSKTSWDQEIPSDAPPAYTPTAGYILHQQQPIYTPPVNPDYMPTVPNTPPVARYQPPPTPPSQQYQQVDYYSPQNRKMSTFHFNSNRGLIGNALDFASHSVCGATSRASAKSTNDATKAVLDTVGGFLDNRLKKNEQKQLQKEIRYERKQECKEMRRRSKCERRCERRRSCCSHSSSSSSSYNPPMPPQCYGGCTLHKH